MALDGWAVIWPLGRLNKVIPTRTKFNKSTVQPTPTPSPSPTPTPTPVITISNVANKTKFYSYLQYVFEVSITNGSLTGATYSWSASDWTFINFSGNQGTAYTLTNQVSTINCTVTLSDGTQVQGSFEANVVRPQATLTFTSLGWENANVSTVNYEGKIPNKYRNVAGGCGSSGSDQTLWPTLGQYPAFKWEFKPGYEDADTGNLPATVTVERFNSLSNGWSQQWQVLTNGTTKEILENGTGVNNSPISYNICPPSSNTTYRFSATVSHSLSGVGTSTNWVDFETIYLENKESLLNQITEMVTPATMYVNTPYTWRTTTVDSAVQTSYGVVITGAGVTSANQVQSGNVTEMELSFTTPGTVTLYIQITELYGGFPQWNFTQDVTVLP